MRNRMIVQAGGLLLWLIASVRGGLPPVVQVELLPDRDATLHSETSGGGVLNLANGAGEYIFAGRTGVDHQTLRRALLHFDVAGSVPADSVILSARLDLVVSKAPPGGNAEPFSLHRVTSDWGEGASDPEGQEGQGATPTPGDATWDYGYFASLAWATPGGDFLAVPSATTSIASEVGSGASFAGPALLEDVRLWLSTGENWGWMLRGNESDIGTARRFYSRNVGLGDGAPVLILTYQVVPEPSTGVLLGAALLVLKSLAGGGRATAGLQGNRTSTR